MTISAVEALQRLQEGNRQFVAGNYNAADHINELKWTPANAGQQPFAVVLGCSDSRVPVEIVFNQGFGDLFVIRVAGNIVAPSQVGSIEFAAEKFGAKLVVVLGHTHCGAIDATLETLTSPAGAASRNLRAIVDRIRPSVQGLLATDLKHNHELLKQAAVRTNISVSASFLRHGSQLIEQLIEKGELLVVGAEYSLETGIVDFFDGLPEPGEPARE
jgi:carbonic anhydrase